jgi:hypothetical protein
MKIPTTSQEIQLYPQLNLAFPHKLTINFTESKSLNYETLNKWEALAKRSKTALPF